MVPKVLPTTVVGSYPQPSWLVNREMLSKVVPRIRMKEIWRVPEPFLEQAQDDATVIAIGDMERAGIDIITDGEMRRESYSNRFATALEGIDLDRPGHVQARSGALTPVPRVVGKLAPQPPGRGSRHGVPAAQYRADRQDDPARALHHGAAGPRRVLSRRGSDGHGFCGAVNQEARDLQKAGADVIQLDEPWVRNNPEAAKRYAVKAINRALEGITVPTVVHICFGYAAVVPGSSKPSGYAFLPELADSVAEQISIESAQPKIDLGVLRELAGKTIMLGVLDLADAAVETGEQVAERIRAGLRYVAPEKLIPAPDCGMKYLARDVAFGKLKALADGAAIVRREIS